MKAKTRPGSVLETPIINTLIFPVYSSKGQNSHAKDRLNFVFNHQQDPTRSKSNLIAVTVLKYLKEQL